MRETDFEKFKDLMSNFGVTCDVRFLNTGVAKIRILTSSIVTYWYFNRDGSFKYVEGE